MGLKGYTTWQNTEKEVEVVPVKIAVPCANGKGFDRVAINEVVGNNEMMGRLEKLPYLSISIPGIEGYCNDTGLGQEKELLPLMKEKILNGVDPIEMYAVYRLWHRTYFQSPILSHRECLKAANSAILGKLGSV